MAEQLGSTRIRVRDAVEASEIFWNRGWADGLPIIPPTEDRVMAFLDYAALEPEQVIGETPERNRSFTAEKVAINAVMAGCLPEYMPVVVAVVEAITAPEYKFNHLASMGSPWPMIYVSGPIVKQLEINTGWYLFGAEVRANATIGRAISLLLRNCADAKIGGLQAGQWGSFLRGGGCVVGENEEVVPWTPLRVQRGFHRDASAVTVIPQMMPPFMVLNTSPDPRRKLDIVAEFLSTLGFYRGTYTVLVPPNMAEDFHRDGWTKESIHDYLIENTRTTLAYLKRINRLGFNAPDFSQFAGDVKAQEVQPGDEERYVYLFRKNPEYDHMIYGPSDSDLPMDVYVVVCGGPGSFMFVHGMYVISAQPVNRLIRVTRT